VYDGAGTETSLTIGGMGPEQESEAVQRVRRAAAPVMERAGIEPATSGLQSRRSPS
jgi:hypothetical protein